VNQVFTNEIKLERGLLQGSILSPLLFNIFIDDLAQQLTNAYPNDPLPHCLLYADDIKLNHNNIKDLQNMLDICSTWAENNGMEFNINKSAYLLKSNNNNNSLISNTYSGFGYGSGFRFRSPSNSSLSSNSSSSSSFNNNFRNYSIYRFLSNYIPNSNNNTNLYLKINGKKELLKGQYSYDYLGFPHTTNGIQWQNHLESSARKALSILESIHFRNDVLPHYIKFIIFKMFIRPMMEHGACLAFYWMNENETKKIQKNM